MPGVLVRQSLRKATSTTTHVVSFSIATNVAAFNFRVQEAYTQPGQTATLYDYAPNSGVYPFQTNADPDSDGLFGSGDKCPTVPARGKSENHNGCPGPFKLIGTKVEHLRPESAFPSLMRLERGSGDGTPPVRAWSSPLPGAETRPR